MEQSGGFLADEVEAAAVVDVVNIVPGDPLCPVLLLQGQTNKKKMRLGALHQDLSYLLLLWLALWYQLSSLDPDLLHSRVVFQTRSRLIASGVFSLITKQ